MGKSVKLRDTHDRKPARLTLYRWAGSWGPFKVRVACGECTLTTDIVKDVMANELACAPVELEVKDWLSHVIEAVLKGARHAPVVMLNGRVISQGVAVNRGLLAEAVMAEHVQHFPIEGTHVFGKDNCGYCTKAKAALDAAGMAYGYHDVVRNPGTMYEMISRTKAMIGSKTPVTTPQIWIDGDYVGGYDALKARLEAPRPQPDNSAATRDCLDVRPIRNGS
jgi:glutaredoxin